MTDRELLEAAAKAAGLPIGYGDGCYFFCEHGPFGPAMYGKKGNAPLNWNPLTDDGDALRLAVKLGIQIRQYPIYDKPRFAAYACEAKWSADAERNVGSEAIEHYDGDPYAATRRAIVSAAAKTIPLPKVQP